MEFIHLDSVTITVRSDGFCFSSYASTPSDIALPDTDLRVWSDLSTEDFHTLQEFLFLHFPLLTSWLDLVVDHLASELTVDRLMVHLLAGGSVPVGGSV